jgi:phosphoglycolate phosphatase
MPLATFSRWKLIVFDLDGTLEDTKEAVCRTVENLLAIFGYDAPPREEILEVVSELTQREAVLTFLPQSVKADEDFKKFAFRYVRLSHQIFRRKHAEAFPGSLECLWKLKNFGVQLGLVTNNSEDAVMDFFDKYGVREAFDVHVSGDLGLRKCEAIRSILARLEVQAGECLFVGDTALDIRESRQACVRAVAVLSGFHSVRRLRAEGPFAILGSVSELPILIEQAQALAMA